MTLKWDIITRQKFESVLTRMPVFLRATAEKQVGSKALQNALDEQARDISERHLIDAFFSETPFGFHGPMMTDLEAAGLDYQKYGYPEDSAGGFFSGK